MFVYQRVKLAKLQTTPSIPGPGRHLQSGPQASALERRLEDRSVDFCRREKVRRLGLGEVFKTKSFEV